MNPGDPTVAFPFLTCDFHPGPQLSYVICIHVLAGKPAAHITEASQTDMGDILCADCHRMSMEKIKTDWRKLLRPICRSCAIEHSHIGLAV